MSHDSCICAFEILFFSKSKAQKVKDLIHLDPKYKEEKRTIVDMKCKLMKEWSKEMRQLSALKKEKKRKEHALVHII